MTFSNNENERERISDGFLDHKKEKCCFVFPLQRPRHFRVALSWLTWSLVVLFPGIFFSAMSVFIIMSLPAFSRVDVLGFANDSAIFYPVNDKGGLILRVCNGKVPYSCTECDDGAVYSSYEGNENDSPNSPTNAPIGTKPQQQVSVFESSSKTSRRAASGIVTNYTGNPHDKCVCGASLLWSDYCPISEDFKCSAVEKQAKDLFTPLMIWTGLGMSFSVLWFPILVPLVCMTNKAKRFFRPITAQVLMFVLCFIIPAGSLYFCGDAINKAAVAYKESTACDDDTTLSSRGYKAEGMFKLWQASVSGLVFLCITVAHFFFGMVYISFFPKPKQNSCWHTKPFRPSDAGDCCCCDEPGECCEDCECCECCDGENCCDCYNDYEEFDSREYGAGPSPNSEIPSQDFANVGIVAGNQTNDSIPMVNTNYPPTTHPSVVNTSYPPTMASAPPTGYEPATGIPQLHSAQY